MSDLQRRYGPQAVQEQFGERYGPQAAGFSMDGPTVASPSSPSMSPMSPMENPFTGVDWQAIENDPKFAEMSYEDQVSVRDDWFRGNAGTLFQQGATPEEVERRYREFLQQPPSVVVEDLSNKGREFLQLAEEIRQMPNFGEASVEERTSLQDATSRREFMQTPDNGRDTDERADRLVDAVLQSVTSTTWAENSTWGRKVINFVGDVGQRLGFLTEEDVAALGGDTTDGRILYTPETNADRNAFEYLLATASENPDVQKKIGGRMALGSMAGVFTDVGVSVAAVSPMTSALRRLSAAARGGDYAGRLARIFARPSTPVIAEATLEGIGMTAADLIREEYTGEPWIAPNVTNDVLRAGVLFGANFLGDMAFWTVGRVIGRTASRMAKNVYRPRALGGGFRRGVESSAGDPTEAVRRFKRTPEVDPRVTEAMDEESAIRATREWLDMELDEIRRMSPEDVGSDEWKSTLMRSKGYDVVETSGGGFELHRMTHDGTSFGQPKKVGVFTSMDETFDGFIRDFDEVMEVRAGRAVGEAGQGQVRLSKIERGKVASDVSEGRLVGLVTPDRTGRLAKTNIESAVSILARKALPRTEEFSVTARTMDVGQWRRITKRTGSALVGVTDEGKYTALRSADDMLRWNKSKRGIEVVVPDGPVQADDVVRMRTSLADVAEAIGDGTTAKSLREAVETAAKSAPTLRRVVAELDALGKRIIHPATGRAIRAGDDLTSLPRTGQVFVESADGTRNGYRSLTEAYLREGDVTWLTEAHLNRYLHDEFGLSLRKSSDGEGYVVWRKDGIVGQDRYRTLEDIVLDRPEWFPKRPIDERPMRLVYDYTGGTYRYDSGAVMGTPQEVIDFADKTFKRYEGSPRTVVETQFGRVEFEPGDYRYAVSMDDIGFYREFESLEEAKQFVRNSKDDYEVLNDIARAAGSRIDFVDGAFRMKLPDGSWAVSKSVEGMRSHLSQFAFETPDMAVDLLQGSGLPKSFVENIRRKYRHLMGHDLGTPRLEKEYELARHVRDAKGRGQGFQSRRMFEARYRPYKAVIRKIGNDLGSDEFVRVAYDEPLAAYDLSRQSISKVRQTVADMFKGVKKKQRIALREAMAHPERPVQEVFEQIGAKWTPRMETIQQSTRELFDELGKRFNIDSYKLLNEYLPRVRRAFDSNPDVNLNQTAGEFLRQTGFRNYNNIPELKFFADNLRTRDLYEMATDTTEGIDDLIMTYATKGYTSKYVQPASLKVHRWLDEGLKSGTVNPWTARYVSGYLELLGGVSTDSVKREIFDGTSDALREALKTMTGKEINVRMERIVHTLQSFTIGAHMAFKPFIPLRNMMQVWTQLGWRIGNDLVIEAMDEFATNPQRYVKDLLDQDVIIHGKAALLQGLQLEGKGFYEKFIDFGMGAFASSDDYNRAITAIAAWRGYDNAVGRLRAGTLSTEEFLEAARIDRLDPSVQRRVVGLTEEGRHDEAKRVLAATWVNETQFDYVSAGNPKIFQGTLGKLFGKYGHYSVNAAENYGTLFKSHVPRKTKLKMAGQLALNTAGLWFAFEKVLGINASNFRPVPTVLFTGGPYWDLMFNILQSADPGFRGKIARSQLAENVIRTFVPLNSYYYNQKQAESLADKGYYMEAFMRGMMAFPIIDPTNPNAR